MAKITNREMRNGCLPNLRSIHFWKRKKEEGSAARGKVVAELMEDKNEDQLYQKLTIKECWINKDVEDKSPVVQDGPRIAKIDIGGSLVKEAASKSKATKVTNDDKLYGKCWMSEDVKDGKSHVEYSPTKLNADASLHGTEATDEKPMEVAEMSRDGDRDAEINIVADEEILDHKSNVENKDISLIEAEIPAGKAETKDMADEIRVDESFTVVEIKEGEKSGELKLIVGQGSEAVDDPMIPIQYQATGHIQLRPNRRAHAPSLPQFCGSMSPPYSYTHIFDYVREERQGFRPLGPIMGCIVPFDPMDVNEFNKVKTYDIRGLINSSGKK